MIYCLLIVSQIRSSLLILSLSVTPAAELIVDEHHFYYDSYSYLKLEVCLNV